MGYFILSDKSVYFLASKAVSLIHYIPLQMINSTTISLTVVLSIINFVAIGPSFQYFRFNCSLYLF